MIKHIHTSILSLLLSTSSAFAEAPKNSSEIKNGASIQGLQRSPIQFKVVAGEKTSIFVVSANQTAGQVNFTASQQMPKSRTIALSDYEFLVKRIASLKGVPNKKEFCPRNYIEVVIANRESVGCLGANNARAAEIQRMVSTLSLLF